MPAVRTVEGEHILDTINAEKRYGYHIEVDYDDDDVDQLRHDAYFGLMDKLGAFGMGHERAKTGSLFGSSDTPLNLEELRENLGELKILTAEMYDNKTQTFYELKRGKLVATGYPNK